MRSKTGPKPTDPVIRLEKFIERIPESGCWIFMGSLDKRGYGGFKFNGSKEKAHRVSYLLHHGHVDKDKFVLHSCDVPSCVNPSHLRLGTHDENMEDMTSRDRSCRRERHWKAKLNETDVLSIRNLRQSGKKLFEIAEMFNISIQHVSALCKNDKWRA